MAIDDKRPTRRDIGTAAHTLILGVACILLAAPHGEAYGGSLSGTLRLPPKFAEPPVVGAPVFWELPNPVLPLASSPADPRARMVVVLEGPAAAEPVQRAKVFRLRNARFEPPVLAVAPGTKLTFENNDPIMHLIESPPGDPSQLKGRSLAPGDAFTHVFPQEGTYRLRCSEVPHMQATVFVTKQPLVALTANDGTFSFADIPADRYLLRVWYDGQWVHRMGVRVRGRATTIDVQIPANSSE